MPLRLVSCALALLVTSTIGDAWAGPAAPRGHQPRPANAATAGHAPSTHELPTRAARPSRVARTTPVLRPDVQAKIIELLKDPGFEVSHGAGWAFRSIGISPTRVTFRLMGPGEADTSPGRARIELLPRHLAAPGERRSKSFAIRVVGAVDDPVAQDLLRRAVASVIQRDTGGLYTAGVEAQQPTVSQGRPALDTWPPLRHALVGLLPVLLWLLALVWLQRRTGPSAAHAAAGGPAGPPAPPAAVTLPWLELPGYTALWFVLVGPLLGAALGPALWLPAGALVTLGFGALAVRRGWLRVTGGLRRDLLQVDTWAAVVAALLIAAWLRVGSQDDPFCHHAFVRLITEGGLPLATPGDPRLPASYHTGFDLLAAAVVAWMPLGGDVEWGLDITSAGLLVALGLGAVSMARATAAGPLARALSVWTLMLGCGPYWLSRWWPALRPSWAPWDTVWEGGTFMSLVALAGRRPAVLAFVVVALFTRLVLSGALNAKALRGRAGVGTGVLLAVLVGGASQVADELVLLVPLAVAALALRQGRRGLRAALRPVLVMVLLAPLAVASGGFAAGVLLRLVGLAPLAGEAQATALLGVGPPAWPSFFGGEVPLGSADWWRVTALEFGPALLAPALLWRRPALRGAAWVVTLWLVVGVLLAHVLRLGGLDYRVDLHRFVEAGAALALALAPAGLWHVARPRWRTPALLAFALLCCAGSVGQLMGRADFTAVVATAAALALAAGLSAGAAATGVGRWLAAGLATCSAAAAAMVLSGWLWTPTLHRAPPPALPPAFARALDAGPRRSPVLSEGRVANWLLLNGRYVAAPHHRADLNPVQADAHAAWLRALQADEARALGVRHYLLSRATMEQLRARWAGKASLQPGGRWPAEATARAWNNLVEINATGDAAPELFWGAVGYVD